MKKNIFNRIIWLLILVFPILASASEKNGEISQASKYAWGEKIGWVNFNPSNGNVRVTDDGLSGYAWSSNYGWINLSPETAGVKNNGEGDLSGKAWNDKLGWIDFSGITVDEKGNFSGTAGDDNSIFGRLEFECDGCEVKTDWRPESVREDSDDDDDDDDGDSSSGGNSGSGTILTSTGNSSLEDSSEKNEESLDSSSLEDDSFAADDNNQGNYLYSFEDKFDEKKEWLIFWLWLILATLLVFWIWYRKKGGAASN